MIKNKPDNLMIRKFQIATRIITVLLFISLYFVYEKANLQFETLMIIYFSISIVIDLLTKIIFINSQKAGKISFYKRKKYTRSRVITIIIAILVIGYLSYIILVDEEIDTTHYMLIFLMIYEIVGFFINFNMVCFIENNRIYLDSVLERPFGIENIAKIELTNDKELLIFDSKKTKTLELDEETSINLKKKVEELQAICQLQLKTED
ncbi:MAG: hypothetical protein ACPG4Y_06215 [Chitinophagales bacterium]